MELTFSQNPYYTTIDKIAGLPSNSVYDLFQDSKGFMWFATGKGLSRYDGNYFKNYAGDFQTSKSGSCIQEDRYGRIWYENFDGFLYYIDNGDLKALPQDKSVGYYKYGITPKDLILLQENEVHFYDLKTLKIRKKLKINTQNIKFTTFYNNKFYVFGEQLITINNKDEVEIQEYPSHFPKQLGSLIIYESQKGLILVFKFSNEYYLLQDNQFIKKQMPFSVDFIQNIGYTKNDNWFCTTKGVYQLNTTTNIANHYFKDSNVSYVYRDNKNNYWVATLTEGVFFIEDFDTKIYNLPTKPFALSSNKNNLIIGADKDEVYYFNLSDNKYKSVYKGENNHAIYQIAYNEDADELYFTDSKFKIYKNNKVQNELNIAIKEVSKIDQTYYSFGATNASGIFKYSNLKSEWDDLYNKNYSDAYIGFKTSFLVTSNNGKSTAYNPLNKTIYYATNNGLFAITKSKKQELKYNNETLFLNKIGYYDNHIYGFSNNEKVYVISNKNSVSLLKLPKELQQEKFERIALENQYLYLFNTASIFRLDLTNKTFLKIFSIPKDIDVYDIKLINDKYYISSSKGIITQKTIHKNKIIPPKLLINNTLVNDKNVVLNKKTALNYDQNNITIGFTVLTFIPNKKYDVLYSINNATWKKLEATNRNLLLSSLSPGDYHIKLKVENFDETLQTISFSIKNPFWLNTYFLLLFATVFLILTYLLYKWKINKIKAQNQIKLEKVTLEKNLNQSKLKAIKSQMNPHFFYNALNTLQSYILSNDKKQAVDYLSKFSNLTRTILELTEKETLTIAEEIKTLQLYLDIEKARFEDDFNFEIILDKDIDADNLKMATMLLQPYVENAIKHGLLHKKEAKNLCIKFKKLDDSIAISIDDNGIGRQKSGELNKIKNKNHVSFATNAMYNRIELLNQYTHTQTTIKFIDKQNQSGQSLGTRVVITIPILY